ncbi:MAG TPA: DinB family protein [Anaerolineae bacterium]
MTDTPLSQSIDRLAQLTQAIPDAALERPWTWGEYDSDGVRLAFFRTYEELRELAVKLRRERTGRGRPPSSAQLILAPYHAAYRDLQAALLGAGAELVNRAPAENEWPLRKTLSHMVGTEQSFYVVVKYALDGHRAQDGRPAKASDAAWDAIVGMDDVAYHALMDGPFDGLRGFHSAFHERAMKDFVGITEEELALPSMFWETAPMSVRFRLHRFDSHMRQHTIQIDKTLALLGHPPTETRRLIRLVYAALAEVEGVMIGAGEVGGEECRAVTEGIEERIGEIREIVG